jgi:hypothetical protein
VTMPMGQLVSPLIGSLGNVEMPIVKKADMNDSGRKMIVTIVKTRTIWRGSSAEAHGWIISDLHCLVC